MKILFTLDDVLRNKTQQVIKIYKKYIDKSLDEESVDITKDGLCENLHFDNIKEYNKFLYQDYAFEIFAEATPPQKMLDKDFSMWHLKINENSEIDENIDVILGNPFEFNNSIGFTYFYLSKIATRIREIYFPLNSIELWDKCDIMVTADRKLLENKPEGKIVVKIKMPYNIDCESDYTYDDLSQFLKDNNFLKKINGTYIEDSLDINENNDEKNDDNKKDK